MKNLLLVITALCLIGCNGSDGGSASGGSSPEFKVLNLSISDSSIEEIRYSTNGMLYQISDGSIECKADNYADLQVDTNFRSDIEFSIPCLNSQDELKRVFLNLLAIHAFEDITLERTQGQNDGMLLRFERRPDHEVNGDPDHYVDNPVYNDFFATYCYGVAETSHIPIMSYEKADDHFGAHLQEKMIDGYNYDYIYVAQNMSRNHPRYIACHRSHTDGLPGDHNIDGANGFYDAPAITHSYRYKEGELEVLITRAFLNPLDQDEMFHPNTDIFDPVTNADLEAYDDSNGTFKVYRYERYQRQL